MQDQMLAALDKASAIALDFWGSELTRTAKYSVDDFVTEADLAVSAFLCDWIQQNFPGHGIQCEELAEQINPGARKRWLIDPIDGTWNFANKDPLWAILLAYLEDDVPTLGAIATPATRAKYFAEKGGGATCNGARLSVRQRESIHGAFIACSIHKTGTEVERMSNLLGKLVDHGCVTFSKLSMYNLCSVAAGTSDGFVSNCSFDYDYAAPLLLCTEAGAVATDSFGNPWKVGARDLVVGSPRVHDGLMRLLNP